MRERTAVAAPEAAERQRIVITGLGVVSPAGVGAGALFDALLAGRSLVGELGTSWASPPHQLGAAIRDVGAKERIPAARLRRMGRLPQLAVVAAHQAQEQAGGAGGDPAATGIVLGTGFGALDETIAFLGQLLAQGPAGANPGLFPASVMNVAAAYASMELGVLGYNTTVNHKEVSAELAVLLAADALRSGRAGRILAGGVDELSEPLHHGYRRLGALASGPARPYRAGRDGVVLGEGSAVLALERLEDARARGGTVLAELAGAGAAGGARPLTSWGPAPEAGRILGPAREAGVAAIRAALAEAELGPEQIDAVIGCGCGSPGLDQLEAEVLREVFGDRAVPLTSPHGALGTFMAAGAHRLATGVLALQRGQLYPTLTAGEPDPEAPVPGLVLEPRAAALRAVLACSHATGGASAALVLTRGAA